MRNRLKSELVSQRERDGSKTGLSMQIREWDATGKRACEMKQKNEYKSKRVGSITGLGCAQRNVHEESIDDDDDDELKDEMSRERKWIRAS